MINTAVDSDNDMLRTETVDVAKKHKASWIQLGQHLYTIYKDKLYKRWGFLAFPTYCKKELGVKESTAQKILKSYSFLEKEEPQITKAGFTEDEDPQRLPDYEAVNVLRLAKQNKDITPEDFSELRASVLSDGREAKEVRSQVKKILTEKEVVDPAEEKTRLRNTLVKRLISAIVSVEKEGKQGNLLPSYLITQIAELKSKLEDQLA